MDYDTQIQQKKKKSAEFLINLKAIPLHVFLISGLIYDCVMHLVMLRAKNAHISMIVRLSETTVSRNDRNGCSHKPLIVNSRIFTTTALENKRALQNRPNLSTSQNAVYASATITKGEGHANNSPF